MAWYRERGWIIGVVERYFHTTRKKADLYGCFDLVAISPDCSVVDFVQTAHGCDHAERKRKVLGNEAAQRIIRGSSADAVVFTWRKGRERGHGGGRIIWKPRRETLDRSML
jgi:hypothetical protein